MKRLIVALCILFAYMAVDAGLTSFGIALGLCEGNSRAMTGFTPHIILAGISMVAYPVEMYLNAKGATRIAITAITLFYVYVLIHNLRVIWRYV